MKIQIYASKKCSLHSKNICQLYTTSVSKKFLKIKILEIAKQLLSNF